jgi:hypothetical protein
VKERILDTADGCHEAYDVHGITNQDAEHFTRIVNQFRSTNGGGGSFLFG